MRRAEIIFTEEEWGPRDEVLAVIDEAVAASLAPSRAELGLILNFVLFHQAQGRFTETAEKIEDLLSPLLSQPRDHMSRYHYAAYLIGGYILSGGEEQTAA